MSGQNAAETRDKILWILKKKGPCLPVHIANETGLSMLFSSAFLSELLSSKDIRISAMRIGSSPLYFLNEHEYMLERFANHLKSKEKDAFIILREKKFLRDSEQAPAIRVALREIRDFAVPFRKNNEIFWRYYLVPESEFPGFVEDKAEKVEEVAEAIAVAVPPAKKEETYAPIKIEEKPLETIIKPAVSIKHKKTLAKKTQRKKPDKESDKFFNKVKDWISNNGMEISDVEGLAKNTITLRVKMANEEQLLVAFNKKKIAEEDIIKAGRKAAEFGLRYHILSLGEPSKKISGLIDAGKSLASLKKI